MPGFDSFLDSEVVILLDVTGVAIGKTLEELEVSEDKIALEEEGGVADFLAT